MNIGIVTTWFERGAAYVSRQYRTVLEHEHAVYIYARGGEVVAQGDLVWDDSSVTWARKARGIKGSHTFDLEDFKAWVMQRQLDLVIFNEQQWWPPIEVCKRMGVKTGAYVDYYTEDTVSLFWLYDFLLCNTKRHYELFKNHPQVFYIPWGTDLVVYRPNESYSYVNSGCVTFFHSAGFSPHRKGTDILLRAAAKLSGNFKIIVHTQVPLEKKCPELALILKKLQDDGVLHIVNETITAPGLYYRGDVYVYPSRLDGIGLTIAEAIASGLPVIVTDMPPMNEFVTEQSGRVAAVQKIFARADGYYWPQALVAESSLIEQMNFYITEYAQLATFKKQARLYAEEYLDWAKNSAQLSSLLLRVESTVLDEELVKKMHVYELRRGGIVEPRKNFLHRGIKKIVQYYSGF